MISRKIMPSPGFSLIEIIVVMFVIGIIMSFVMLSVGQSHAKVAQDEIRRLHALIKLGKEEAVLQNQELALDLFRNGYGFSRLAVVEGTKNWKWLPIGGDKLLRPRCFPPNVRIELELEGVEAQLKERDCQMTPGSNQVEKETSFLDDANADDSVVRVFFLSSGEMTPFKMIMFLEDIPTQGLDGELTGDLKIVLQGDLSG